MQIIPFIIIILMLITLSVVIIGVAKLASGKKIESKKSNKLMSLRVALQALVIAILAILYFMKR